ncbi:predicted protein [Naegleria gruberi]|uniref:Predicted protein n=1 Tax=Naegleria gruberi TaxID=5762 RepID=D2V574_NAEGR|nr:uncharacterized protein NAEGRDRAFT_46799 [Naegleria gruberi]EFC48058.1 predicted protein [Naegleria gruberi]|eukprot:XP_002680802.1 predicted protein [Naegleria gruberi strain NEG-M]
MLSNAPPLLNKTIGQLVRQETVEKPLNQSSPQQQSKSGTTSSAGQTVVLSVIPDDKKNLESRGGKTLMLNVEVIGESKFKVLSSTKSKISEVYETICSKIGLNSEVLKKPIDIKDLQAEILFVKQLHHFFTTRLFKGTEKQSILMASLMIQMNFGDYDHEKHKIGFLKPQKRTFIGMFTSRVEYLVRYYMEINARGRNVPLKTICKQLDDVIDDDTTLTSLKVGRGDLDDGNVSFLLDPLEVCCAYKADISFPWKENLNLTSLDFGGNIIRAESGRLIDVISYFTNLTYLNLSGVFLYNEKKKFLEFLTVSKSLEGLELSMCGLDHKFLKSIMEIVMGPSRSKLKILNVSKNRLKNKSLELIYNSMEFFSYEELNIAQNKFKAAKDNMVKEFFRKLEPNQKITKLDISGMNIGEKMGEYLTELIAVSASLQVLKMSNVSINGLVFYRIGRILRTHPSLSEIDLSMNKIFQKLGIEEIEDAFFFLSSNKRLISIDISDCSINEKEGEYIAKFMKENTTIDRFSIAGNTISTSTYDLPPIWMEMIEQNTILNLFDFTNCKLSRRGIISLLSAMNKSNSAKELYMGRNLIDFTIPEIRENFKKLKLRVVDMRMMSINDKQIPLVASILTENPYIEIVNFESNLVTFNGGETFVKIVGKKTNLKKVVFVCNRIKEPEKPVLFNLFITHTNINHVVL